MSGDSSTPPPPVPAIYANSIPLGADITEVGELTVSCHQIYKLVGGSSEGEVASMLVHTGICKMVVTNVIRLTTDL